MIGDNLDIAVRVKNMSEGAIDKLLRDLSKIPSGMGINIELVKKNFGIIRDVKSDLKKVGEAAEQLSGHFGKAFGDKALREGKDQLAQSKKAFNGLVKVAEDYDKKWQKVTNTVASADKVLKKSEFNAFKRNLGGLGKEDVNNIVGDLTTKMSQAKAILDKLMPKWTPAKIAKLRPDDKNYNEIKKQALEYSNLDRMRESAYKRSEAIAKEEERTRKRILAEEKAARREADRLYAKEQQSARTKKSVLARDAAALDQANFDRYIRHFRNATPETQAKSLERWEEARKIIKKDRDEAEAKLLTIGNSDSQAVKNQSQLVTILDAKYKSLTSQIKAMNNEMDKANKKASSELLRAAGVDKKGQLSFHRLQLRDEDQKVIKNFKELGWEGRIKEMAKNQSSIDDVINRYNQLMKTPIDKNDSKALDERAQKIKELGEEYARLLAIRQKMEASDKAISRREDAESKRSNNEQERNQRALDNLFSKVKNDTFNRNIDKIKSAFGRLTKEQQDSSLQKLNSLIANKQKELNALQKKTVDKSDTEAVNAHRKAIADLNAELKRLNATKGAMEGVQKNQERKTRQQETKARQDEAKALRESRKEAAQFNAELNTVQYAMQGTSQIAQQLRDNITQAFSSWILQRFWSNLVEIGGQFEYQRRAITNILQDGTKANKLFEQIKELGMHSPFSTLELDTYAKQLSAFDVPYHKMYDTLKKLSDIAAGTGADMSRIILAYGHVKSEGFLTGIQRRQFSNANINIVGGLAKYYTEQEGQQVTTRDVYKRIHDKQVSFDDMETVLMSMAEEGGQFFNMQEVMASSVKGVYKNLSDAWNHAYMAMEQSANGPLMAVGKGLTYVLNLVEKFPSTVMSLASAFMALNAIRAVSSRNITKESALLLKKVKILDKERIATGKLKKVPGAVYGKSTMLGGTGFSKETTKQLSNLIKQKGVEGQLLKQEVLREIRNRKINKETAEQLWKLKAITREEYNAAIAARSWTNILQRGFKAAGVAALGFIKSLGPMAAMTIAFEGFFYLWDKFFNSDEGEEKSQAIQSLTDSMNSLNREMEALSDKPFDSMYTSEVYEEIKAMVDNIKNNLSDSELILGRVFQKDANGEYLKNTVQQAKELRSELEKSSAAMEFLTTGNNLSLLKESDEGKFKEYTDEYVNKRDALIKYFSERPAAGVETRIETFYNSVKKFIGTKEGKKYKELFNEKNGNKFEALLDFFDNNDAYSAFYSFVQNVPKTELGAIDYENSEMRHINNWNWNEQVQDYFTATKDLDKYIKTNIGIYQRNLTNAGKKYHSEQYPIIMEYLGGLEGITDGNKRLLQRRVTKNHYSAMLGDSNVTIPKNHTEEYRKVTEAINADTIRGFKHSGEMTVLEYYDAFQDEYKKVIEGFDILKKIEGFTHGKSMNKLPNPDKDSNIEAYNKLVERYVNVINAADALGFNENDLEKEGNSKKDSVLEALKIEYTNLNNAYQCYKEGLDGGLGSEEALKTLEDFLEYKSVIEKLKSRSLSGFVELIDKFVTDNEALLKNSNENDRKKFYQKIQSDAKQREIDVLKRNAKDASESAKKQFSESFSDYEMYKRMYNATGSHKQAGEFVYGEENVAAKLGYEHYVKDAFNKLMRDFKIDINYDSALNFNETEWETIPNWVKPIFKEAKDAIEKWTKKMQESYIDLIAANKSYNAQVEKINKEHEDAVEVINIAGKSDQDKVDLRLRADAKRDLALEELRLERIAFGNRVSMMSEEEVTKTINDYVNLLKKALETGAISDSEYSSKMNEVQGWKDKRREETTYGDRITTAFLKGGVPSIMKTVEDDYKKMLANPGDYTQEEKEELKAKYKEYFGEDGNGGIKSIQDFIEALEFGAKSIKASLDLFANMFDALGNESIANGMGTVSSVLGGAMNGASALEFLGPYGQIAGGVIGSITAIAQEHDKAINRSIEQSKQRVKDLQSDFKDVEREQERKLTNSSADEKEKFDNLVAQREELNRQLDLERDKKKKDKDAIRELNDQLSEMDDKIKYYWSDLLKEIYGLDFSSIADKLTKALTKAFENGEDAAIAWRQTVGDIVRELANEILAQKYIKPMLDQVFEEAFGTTGKLANKTELTDEDVTWLGDRLNAVGEEVIPQAEVLYKALQQAFPYSSNSETVGGFTRLGEQLTEKTGTVMAGYINSIRADVSANRRNLNLIVGKGIPALESINIIAQSQLSCLNNIAEHTRTASLSTRNIENLLNKVISGDEKFYIE